MAFGTSAHLQLVDAHVAGSMDCPLVDRVRASEALLATRLFRKQENPVRFRAEALRDGAAR